ncbi:MAG: cupredoxin domain-containing protein [Cytophagaceae bacterium]|nr:cupredoxin domain-containing protein [Gemmatimonadaceae bacterium]
MKRILLLAALATASSAASAQDVSVTLSEWKMRLSRDTVPAGPVTFQIRNTGAMSHAVHVTGEGVDKGTRQIAVKETGTLTLSLKAGTYEVFCPLAEGSHKMAGMTRTLVVTAAGTPPAGSKPGA